MKIETKRYRCPQCRSLLTHYRIKTEDMVCRGCGYVGEKREFEEKLVQKED